MKQIPLKLDETLQKAVDEKRLLEGIDDFTLAAGKELKIETAPQGEEHLATTVPAGKEWLVRIEVKIEEVDV